MNKEKQKQLEEKFPGLFTKVEPALEPYDQRGIECDDGWFDLIESLAQFLTQLKNFHPKENRFRAAQVKEKFGCLRFYFSGPASEEARGAVNFATNISTRLCEVCGHPGSLRQDKRWIRTLCDTHAAERQ